MKDRFPILTIGHSNHSAERFRNLLDAHGVEMILDVRSSPYSRHAPQFNRQDLTEWLSSSGVEYLFAGKSLGGRPANPLLYESGRVSYAKMALTTEFISSLRRLVSWSRTTRCALLCAEAEPLDCHRFLLIGKALSSRQIHVQHILPDGRIEPHEFGERRLVRFLKMDQSELFDSTDRAIAKAYEIQELRVAFRTQVVEEGELWIGQE
jgi:uncharacterized protein (DUF488 family)